MPGEPYRPQIDWPPGTPEHLRVPVGYCVCGCRRPSAECLPEPEPEPEPEKEPEPESQPGPEEEPPPEPGTGCGT